MPSKEKKEYQVSGGYQIDWNKFTITVKCNKDDIFLIASPSAFLVLLVDVSYLSLNKCDKIIIKALAEKNFAASSKEEKQGIFKN